MPDPVFRYFSKLNATYLFGRTITVINLTGNLALVAGT